MQPINEQNNQTEVVETSVQEKNSSKTGAFLTISLGLLALLAVVVVGMVLLIDRRSNQDVDNVVSQNDSTLPTDEDLNDDFADFDEEDFTSDPDDIEETIDDVDTLVEQLDSINSDFQDFSDSEAGVE